MISFLLYLLFTVSYFLHLPSRLPVLGVLRVELMTGLLLVVSTMVSGRLGHAWSTGSPLFRRLAWLVAFILLSVPLVTWPGSVIRFHLIDFSKVVFFFLITAAVIDSEKRLKIFLLVFLACQLFRVFEPLYLHLTTGYWGDKAFSHVGGEMTALSRLAGAPSDIVNPNQLAWVIVSSFPFVYYLGLLSGRTLVKVMSVPLIVAMGYTLTLTGSRSGIVSLLVVIVSICYLGPNRGRRFIYMSAILVPVGLFGIARMDSDLQTRYISLIDHSAVGGDTAAGRVDGLLSQLKTVSGNPAFGHGLGTSRETNFNIHGGRGQITHNLYIEAAQEIGLVGLALFLCYIRSFGRLLIATYAECRRGSKFVVFVLKATLVWYVMDLVYAFSCFGLSSWEWYLFGGVVNACWVLSRKESGKAVTTWDTRLPAEPSHTAGGVHA